MSIEVIKHAIRIYAIMVLKTMLLAADRARLVSIAWQIPSHHCPFMLHRSAGDLEIIGMLMVICSILI